MSNPQLSPILPDISTGSRDPQTIISAWIAMNPALLSRDTLKGGKSWIDASAFCNHVNTFGYAILNDTALELVRDLTAPHQYKVLSLFTGLGYAEAQMVARGMKVIGFDRRIPAKPWLLDVHEGPGDMSFNRFHDRALFLSFPDPTKKEYGASAPVSFISRYLEAGGTTVITINEARPRVHAIKCDQELLDLLNQGRCVGEVALPKWPTVMCFTGRGHTHHDFRPVLKVHQF
jgi:hypothetical protein